MKTILSVMLLAGLAVGCDNKTMTNTSADMAQHHMAGPPDLGCYGNPQTSTEILNSCPPAGATVDKIDKNPTLPLLNKDGSRPPLP